MNPQHLNAFLWLRWRLFVNQVTRGGIANKIILAILAVGAVFLALGLLAGLFLVGFFLLAKAESVILLFVWDGIVFLFIFTWMLGLLTELQRAEAFSLDKFLHLPVSPAGAFVLNYLSSLLSLTLLLFVPLMLGLTLGLIFSKGPLLLLQLPLAATFVFMVTALSYQFQGWLASLMVNKRRRRTIIVVVTLAFILIFQLPTLVNIYQPWNGSVNQLTEEANKKQAALERELNENKIDLAAYRKRKEELHRNQLHRIVDRGQETKQWAKEWAWFLNMAIPIGWLPWGSASAADGNPLPALFGTLAFTAIGSTSLWRAYRTSLRLYTGQFTSGARTPARVEATLQPKPKPEVRKAILLEKAIPGLSEQATIVALAGFQSFLRAPEVKTLLLSPLIMIVIFGGLFLRGNVSEMPDALRPLIGFGAIAMMLLTTAQLAGNQFGFDRGGFRIFVLSPAPRRDILLGKNLAIAPLIFVLTVPLVIIIQIVLPMRLSHVFAFPFQFVSMFLLSCMQANMISILAPMPISAGSLKPASAKMGPALVRLVFMFVLQVTLSLTLLPMGIEAGLEALGWIEGFPLALTLAALECAAVIFLYRVVLTWEGKLLQAREQKILEVVTTKDE